MQSLQFKHESGLLMIMTNSILQHAYQYEMVIFVCTCLILKVCVSRRLRPKAWVGRWSSGASRGAKQRQRGDLQISWAAEMQRLECNTIRTMAPSGPGPSFWFKLPA